MTQLADLRDTRFVLFDLLRLDEVLGQPPYEELDRETLEQMLAEGERFSREQLEPLNEVGDRVGCTFADGEITVPPGFPEVYEQFCDLGFLSAGAPPEDDGMGLPQAVILALDEFFVAANCAFTNFPALGRACSNMLRKWGSDEQKELYMEGLLTGRWQGTMCLTEDQAGSYVGATRCMARPSDNGRWLLSGQKTFITSGDSNLTDNVIHMVLARTPDAPDGVKGLSLFLVPKLRLDDDGEPGEFNDVRVIGIEEKMGIHGSVTTTLSFGDEGQCYGELVGPLHGGIRVMFHIMNEERIQVGLQGEAIGAIAYNKALEYARERVQGVPITSRSRSARDQVPIIQHPDVRRMLLTMKAYVDGCRAMLLKAGAHIDRARAATDEDTRRLHEGWVDLLTPICKAYGSEVGFEVTVLAMQVLGGAGYIRESGVEQHMRDSRIASVYEGTNGIQAQDLLFRKARMHEGALVKGWSASMRSFTQAHSEHPRLGAEVQLLEEARASFDAILGVYAKRMAGRQMELMALTANTFLRFCGNLMVAWLLLEEAIIAAAQLAEKDLPEDPAALAERLESDPASAHLAAKEPTARFFLRSLLPENLALARIIEGDDRSALDVVL